LRGEIEVGDFLYYSNVTRKNWSVLSQRQSAATRQPVSFRVLGCSPVVKTRN
jgi:hypothetical protein